MYNIYVKRWGDMELTFCVICKTSLFTCKYTVQVTMYIYATSLSCSLALLVLGSCILTQLVFIARLKQLLLLQSVFLLLTSANTSLAGLVYSPPLLQLVYHDW